jgi:hypothetical protein
MVRVSRSKEFKKAKFGLKQFPKKAKSLMMEKGQVKAKFSSKVC